MGQGHERGERGKRGDSPRSATMFVAGVCSGAMVGTGVALLFAPRSGSQVREQLARAAAHAGALASRMIDAVTQRGEGAARGDTAALLNRHLARATEFAGPHTAGGLATLGEVAATHLGDGGAAARG